MIRIKHFHEVHIPSQLRLSGYKSNDFLIGSRKNRLVGTIATLEQPDGMIAVGISCCHPKDIPNRKMGVHIATERLNRFLNGRKMDETHARLMTRDELVQMIKENRFFNRNLNPGY